MGISHMKVQGLNRLQESLLGRIKTPGQFCPMTSMASGFDTGFWIYQIYVTVQHIRVRKTINFPRKPSDPRSGGPQRRQRGTSRIEKAT